jgi:hypothetical protein
LEIKENVFPEQKRNLTYNSVGKKFTINATRRGITKLATHVPIARSNQFASVKKISGVRYSRRKNFKMTGIIVNFV